MFFGSTYTYYLSFSSAEPAGKVYSEEFAAWDTATEEAVESRPEAQRPVGMPDVATEAFRALYTVRVFYTLTFMCTALA